MWITGATAYARVAIRNPINARHTGAAYPVDGSYPATQAAHLERVVLGQQLVQPRLVHPMYHVGDLLLARTNFGNVNADVTTYSFPSPRNPGGSAIG